MSVTLDAVTTHADSPKSLPGYAVVPRAVLTDSRLSDRAKVVYCLLDARTTGRAIYVRVDVLAADLAVSPRTVERSLAELVALGYVVRERTRGVTRTAVLNPIRTADRVKASVSKPSKGAVKPGRDVTGEVTRTDRCDAPDPTDMSGTSRNNSLRSKNKIKIKDSCAFVENAGNLHSSRDPVPVGAAASAVPLAETYVLAIAQATGLNLKPTNAAKALVLKIAARGMSPAEAGEAAHGRLLVAQALRAIHSPEAFLAKTVLEDLAEGLSARREVPTPIPPPAAEVLAQSRPSHFPVSLDDRANAAERGVAACRDALKGLDIDAIAPDPFDDYVAQQASQSVGSHRVTA